MEEGLYRKSSFGASHNVRLQRYSELQSIGLERSHCTPGV